MKAIRQCWSVAVRAFELSLAVCAAFASDNFLPTKVSASVTVHFSHSNGYWSELGEFMRFREGHFWCPFFSERMTLYRGGRAVLVAPKHDAMACLIGKVLAVEVPP